MGTGQESRRPKVMRVATRCRTVEELIAAFATLVDEQSLVVLTDQQRVIGSRQPFVVELVGGEMVMKGEAEVVESTAPPKGRLRLKFLTLDATGREIHQRMVERKRGIATGVSAGNGKPRPPTEPGLKPLVRIPEPVKKGDSSGAVTAATPAATLAPAPALSKPASPLGAVPIIPPKAAAAPATGTLAPRKPQLTPPPSAAVPSIPSVKPGRDGTMRMLLPIKPPATPTGPNAPLAPPEPAAAAPLPAAIPQPIAPADSVQVTRVDPRTAQSTAVGPDPAVTPPPANDVARGPGPILAANDLPDFDEAADVDTSVDRSIPLPPGVAVRLPVDRAKSAQPEEGDRTPGSPYILPANPFGDVAPESLEAFVECTVYEVTGQFVLGEDGIKNELAEPLFEPVAPATAPTTPPAATPTTLVPGPAPAPPQPAPAMLAQPPEPLPEWARPHATPPPQPYAAAAPVAAPHAAPPRAMVADPDAERRRRKRLGVILGGVAAVGLVVGVVASQCGGGGDSARAGAAKPEAAADPPAPADAGVAAKIPEPEPDPDPKPEPDPEQEPDPDPEADPVADTDQVPPPIALGPGDCEVIVMTDPAGARVSYAGRLIGETPLRSAVPCGTGKLSVSYRRYAPVEKTIAPRTGEPAEVKLRLERPEQKVTIRSNPPNAMITVNGKTLGKAPLSATVKGFTSIKIKAELNGYLTWSQKVYVKKDSKTFTATLKKSPKRKR